MENDRRQDTHPALRTFSIFILHVALFSFSLVVAMVVALLSVELFLPGSQSLKDKRMVLRRVKDRLAKFNVAVAEVEHHDLWQRAGLGIVTIGTTRVHTEQELAAVADEIERIEPGAITRTEIEFLA
ncbi:MAG TPA: DUF503 domain-containing protein [Vicinamibacterales bacterium]|jgi:hypothetical protein